MSEAISFEIKFYSISDDLDERFEEFLDHVLTEIEAHGYEADLAARLAEQVADFAVEFDPGASTSDVSKLQAILFQAIQLANERGGFQFIPKDPIIHRLEVA